MHLPQLPQPNPLTTICIYIAGIFIALQQASKSSPNFVEAAGLPNLTAGAWNFLPLFVLTLGGLIWIYRGLTDARPAPAPATAASQARTPTVSLGQPIPERAPPPKEGREFIENTTFPALVAKLGGKTDLQKQTLARPYIGKWMRSRGVFRNVTTTQRDKWLAFIEIDGESTAFMFDHEWLDQLSAIGVGDEVVVDGKINSLTHGARFEQCELVDVVGAKSRST